MQCVTLYYNFTRNIRRNTKLILQIVRDICISYKYEKIDKIDMKR